MEAQQLTQVHKGSMQIIMRDPIPFGALSLLLVPICVAVFFNCWIKAMRKRKVTWQPTVLKIATLTIASTMLLQICTSLYDGFYDSVMLGGELANSASLQAMHRLTLAHAHACTAFSVGFLAVGFCLVLIIIANRMKDKNNDLPTSGDTERR